MLQQQESDNRPGTSSASAVKMSTQLTISGRLAKSAPFLNESVKHKQLVDAAINFIWQGLQPLKRSG